MLLAFFLLSPYALVMPEENKPITVRCESQEEREILEAAAAKEKRKLGPYLAWAAVQYTLVNHKELFPKKK